MRKGQQHQCAYVNSQAGASYKTSVGSVDREATGYHSKKHFYGNDRDVRNADSVCAADFP